MWVIDDQQYLGKLDGWNRASQFADGLFETMVIKHHKIQGLSFHSKRMAQGLTRLNIQSPGDDLDELFLSYAHIFCEHSALKDGVLKVIVSRGDSQRGYAYDDNIRPHVTAFFNPFPQYNERFYSEGVDVTLLNTQCSIQPQLAGLKHLNRLENVLAKNELSDKSFEGLMTNHLGFVIEGTMSNAFFERDGMLYTPSLLLSGVDGVMRQCVLKYAKRKGISVVIEDILVSDLDSFKHGLICNSVLGIVPIRKLQDKSLDISQTTVSLIKAWNSGDIYE